MNFIANESPEKLRGGYYTPDDLADYLARWVAGIEPRRIMEPSVGDGAFIRALQHAAPRSLRELVAFELDNEEAAKAREAARGLGQVATDVHTGDFLAWALANLDRTAQYDAVLGNPPFIRYQYLASELQGRAEKIIRRFNLPFTKHTNAWVPFVVASMAMLRPGGRLAMVVPAELLHVLHAQSVRTYLLDQCSKVVVLDPEEIWFEGTLQGVVLLLAEKKLNPDNGALARVAIRKVRGREFLTGHPSDVVRESDFTEGESLPAKWMLALIGARERRLLLDLTSERRVARFRDVAKVAVGIVTGANKFFLVPDRVVDEFGLHAFAKPMFGRSEHVPGVIYDERVHEANRRAGLPTNFLWFEGISRSDLSPDALRYIERGEAESLHTRYKCRIREPWFTVPSVFTAPVGMLKRSHDFPRLVLNSAGAYTTDTAYRIEPKTMRAEQLVYVFVNSLTALTAELEGRHYGGGVLELVPSEINRLLVPRPVNGGHDLGKLDAAFRRGAPPEEVFAQQDAALLGNAGLTASEMAAIRDAWSLLRNRRQRNGHDDAVVPLADEEMDVAAPLVVAAAIA